jgi:hypothetical protein
MGVKSIRVQVIILFLLILANFLAQIPYYLHLYYNPNNLLAQLRGGFLLLIVFAVFLLASFLLFKRTVIGYWLMVMFLAVEFLFYVWNTLGGVLHGYGFLYHLANPDLILRAVFAIGYVNLFVSGYFLCLLLLKRAAFLDSQEREKPLSKYSV